jgi:hypothetical protein
VGSNICRDIKEAREEIVRLRRTVTKWPIRQGKDRSRRDAPVFALAGTGDQRGGALLMISPRNATRRGVC